MTFEVLVDDNFHFGDEDERISRGTFDTYADAEAVARQIVEASVQSQYTPGMSPAQLLESYRSFGDDPFIRPSPPEAHFSAWQYAEAFIPIFLANRPGQISPTCS
jgi:hypothetical protein